jgi:uncharacterized damage-inducible protein DinB
MEPDDVPARWNASPEVPDMWVAPAEDPRFAAPSTELEGERATLLDYLRAYRITLEMKCAGLDAEQLARRSVPPSTMSLLGLIRHMAECERGWFRRVMAGADAPPLYRSTDMADGDWLGAIADPAVVEQAWQDWRDEVAFAEKFVADSPDLGIRGTKRDGSTIALREVLVHMIEEYARHCGHADLLRERIDGRTGQLSPVRCGRPTLAMALPSSSMIARAPGTTITGLVIRAGIGIPLVIGSSVL